ncbi:MAG: hypothetical protein K0S26_2524 [Bacteroidota bacterium]|jgi:hypothetical protein|nr:hypothetical protein [Bacteroidota bacterium]
MKPKANIITFQTPLASCWLEGKTLCISSNNLPRTKENIREHYQVLKGIVRRKVCWMLHFETCQNFDEEVSAVIDEELPRICTCIAIIAKTDCEKLAASYFQQFEKVGIPVKLCESEREARVWLKRLDNQRRGISKA